MKTTAIALFLFTLLCSTHATAQEAAKTEKISDFSQLVKLLERDSVTHKTEVANSVVSIPTQKGPIDSVLVIRWDANEQIVHFVQPMTLVVPENRIAQVEAAISRLNHAMPYPGLGLNHDTKSTYFRMSVPTNVRGGLLDVEIQSNFSRTVGLAAQWQPILKDVIDGKVEPQNVVAYYNSNQFPKGRYATKVANSDWTLEFSEQNSVTLQRDGVTVVESKFEIRKQLIRFTDTSGPLAVETPGTYQWKIEKGKLLFRPVEDSSDGRKMVLSTQAWAIADTNG